MVGVINQGSLQNLPAVAQMVNETITDPKILLAMFQQRDGAIKADVDKKLAQKVARAKRRADQLAAKAAVETQVVMQTTMLTLAVSK